MNQRIKARRERVLERLEKSLPTLKKDRENIIKQMKGDALQAVFANELPDILQKNIDRVEGEILSLKDKLSGKKKMVVNEKGNLVVEVPKERWFIDIYAIHLGYIKNSERRKNKGKSRKKMKKMKTKSFVKSIVAQKGMIEAFKEGRMGISPKTHTFTMRKEELTTI